MSANNLSDAIFKQIVDSNWVAVFFADMTGIIQYTNKEADKLYGYDRLELVGTHVRVFDGEENAEAVVPTVLQDGIWSGELLQKRKDGSAFPALLTVWMLKDEEGNNIGLVSNSKDLTKDKEVEKRIKETEEVFKLLLDSLPIGIYILDGTGKPYYVNEFTRVFAQAKPNAAVQEFGKTDEWEVYRHNSNEKYPVEELPILRALKGEKTTVSDIDLVLNNTKYNVSASGQPVVVNGELKFAVSTFSDVSDLVAKQKEIESREEEIQALINSHDSFFFSVDRDYKLIRYNNTFKTAIGLDCITKDGFCIKDVIPPNQLEETLKIYRKAFSGESVLDERIYQTDEGVYAYETRYAPIYRDGEIYAVSVLSQNVTERKNKEDRLRLALNELEEKQSEIDAIINNTDAMIMSLDENYCILSFNEPFKMEVLTRNKVEVKRGMCVLDLIHPDHHPYANNCYKTAFSGKRSIEEFTYDTPSGLMTLETRYSPIVSPDGIKSIAVVAQDISKRKENELVLRNMLDEKEFLLGEIHHRVKNNLAIVNSLLQLEELKTDNEEIKNILISSQNRIKSTALVHQFLYQNDSIAKIQFKKYLEEFIQQIKESLLADKRIKVEIFGNDFNLDINQAIPCGLILNELFTNAVKHAFAKDNLYPKISIHLEHEDNKVIITFKDNGVGLPSEFKTYKTLGMTVVQTLVKQLKGQLTVNVVEGTSFVIVFSI